MSGLVCEWCRSGVDETTSYVLRMELQGRNVRVCGSCLRMKYEPVEVRERMRV